MDFRDAELGALPPALIMGNGPSLINIDFQRCNEFATFGMNAAYRHWRNIDWWPDYYSCLDLVVGESHREAIAWLIEESERLGIRQFLLRRNLIRKLGSLACSDRVACYEHLLSEGGLPKLRDVTTGSHTLLWAESLGYQTILLAGVDCNYIERVPGSIADAEDGTLTITRQDDNPNYYFPGYQQVGDTYNEPNPTPDLHLRSWENVARHIKAFTVVVNLNPDSQVRAFDRNDNPESWLEVGRRIPADLDSSNAYGRPMDAGTAARLLKRRLAGLNRCYTLKVNPDVISEYLTKRLAQGADSAADPWRKCFGKQHFSWQLGGLEEATQTERANSSPHLIITFQRGSDDRFKPTLDRTHDASEAEADLSLTLTLSNPARIHQFIGLIRSIYADIGYPTTWGRASNLINRTAKWVWQALPRRVRAIDFAGALHRLRT